MCVGQGNKRAAYSEQRTVRIIIVGQRSKTDQHS